MHALLICGGARVWTLAAILAAWPAVPATGVQRESERLAVFEGTWTREDASSTVKFRETCAWLAGGRRHMVCSGRVQRATEAEEHLKVFSYRAADRMFVVYSAIGSSPAGTYTGGPDGDRWIFDFQSADPDSPRRLRIVITPSANAIRFVEESSQSGGSWQVTEDYRYVRVKDP